jgi:MoxR-like ATPase
MHHLKYDEGLELVKANIPVLFTGEAGSGKTTLAKQIADALSLEFFSISMTRQTTLSHLLGFMSVNGEYIPSALRRCFEKGGMMLLDELDAGDPNVLLSLNTIENGYISFPDALVECHPDFRLAATANPQDQHNIYTGRSKLDAATLDRFDIVDIDRDDKLEKSLVSEDTHTRMQLLRKIMKKNNCAKGVSMRDCIRYQKRVDLKLINSNFVNRLAQKNDLVYEAYMDELQRLPKYTKQEDCKNYREFVDLLRVRANMPPESEKTEIPEAAPANPG